MKVRVVSTLVLILATLFTAVRPAQAAGEVPEPFCGELAAEDCEILRASSAAMFELESYTTALQYRILQHNIPELPAETEAVLYVTGSYAFDRAARDAMRTLAIISREEPLAAVQLIGESPDLLLDLYAGMTADLVLTLDLSNSWTRLLAESDVEWPATTNVGVRLIDGVLYFDIGELKPLIPELADLNDWVAIEIVATLQQLADAGAFEQIAAEVAASSEGRSVWGLDTTMINLITSMRAAFGRPENLWPYMEISRRRDVDLGDQDGAVFRTDFATLDFILSDEFRDLLTQVAEVAAAGEETEVSEQELKGYLDFFWFLAPAIFRDLEISGTSAIGLEDNYQHEGETIFHWDLTGLIQAIAAMSGEELGNLGDEIYIDFSTKFENSAFNEAVAVTTPDDAQIIPLDSEAGEELVGNSD